MATLRERAAGAIVSVLRSFRTSPANTPTASMALQEMRRVGKANVALFRNWAEHSEWVRAAINIRKAQVASAEWDIVPVDPELKFDEDLRKKIRDSLRRPNPRVRDSFRSFIEPIIEDLLVLDAGVIEKERRFNGKLFAMHAVDAGKIKVSTVWDGENPKEARYYWYPDGQLRASFVNEDMIYISANGRTYSVLGLSPLETLKLAIDSELSTNVYNTRQVQNAAPDGMLDLGEGARPDQVEGFKSYWFSEVAGKGALAFIGGSKNAKFSPFRASNRDMQFREWQDYLVRKIAAVFGLAPQDLNQLGDTNRATADVQQENTDDRGLRPLLQLIQDFLTREWVWDDSWGGPDTNLMFAFTKLNLRESMSRAQIGKIALGGMGWRTMNEQRKLEGYMPMGDVNDKANPFNWVLVMGPQGPVLLQPGSIPTAQDYLDGGVKVTPAADDSPPKKNEQKDVVPVA